MNKACPYCHVDDFRLLDFFALDYFSPSLCRNCGKLVRNSGWSQLLGPVTTVLLMASILLLTRWIPEWLAFSLLILLAPLPILFFAKPTKFDYSKQNPSPFHPNPKNDKRIVVHGWDEDEMRRIVDDFIIESAADKPLKVEIHKRFDQEFSLTFPEDLSPFDFAALVNYLNYPIDFEVSNRSIVVAGKTSLNSDFQGIPASLVGKKAIVYVPEGDQDYTVVHMHSEVGNSCSISLADASSIWQPIPDAKLSSQVKMLVNQDDEIHFDDRAFAVAAARPAVCSCPTRTDCANLQPGGIHRFQIMAKT